MDGFQAGGTPLLEDPPSFLTYTHTPIPPKGKSIPGGISPVTEALCSLPMLLWSGNLEMTGHNSYPQITHSLVVGKDIKHIIMTKNYTVF